MVISEDGGLSAIIKEGDYFVLRSNKSGVEVEYSPDGNQNGPARGAFASLTGTVLVWNTNEIAPLIESYKSSCEAFLLREARRAKNRNRSGGDGLAKTKDEKLTESIKAFAANYGGDEVWDGYLPAFHRDIISTIDPSPLDKRTKDFILSLAERLPGFTIDRLGRNISDVRIQADWSAIANA